MRPLLMTPRDARPPIAPDMPAQVFDQWHWSKPELLVFCERLGLSKTGLKAVLRRRVVIALGGVGVPEPPNIAHHKPTADFNWARSQLTLATVITPNVSFGPNFRGFMRQQIGKPFSCHSDFMQWVRENPGRTLADAVTAWKRLQARYDTPGFRREIAPGNNYLRYLRAFRDHHPELTLQDAKTCWHHKKLQPTQSGDVRYSPADLACLPMRQSQP
jgi:Domain of unknown function (DUF6434)/SAP domain-containing new25